MISGGRLGFDINLWLTAVMDWIELVASLLAVAVLVLVQLLTSAESRLRLFNSVSSH